MWTDKRPIDDYNFYSLLGIVQSGMWLQKDIEGYLRGFDLSYGRFSILLSLFESGNEGRNGSDMARQLGISKTTVSKMIKRLIEDGYVAPRGVNADKRVCLYGLSERGKERLEAVVPGYLVRMRVIGSNISVDEKRALISILRKINFIDSDTALSAFEERPLSEKAKEIEAYCTSGTAEDIDRVMAFLDETADVPLTRVIDFYLGTVDDLDGMRRIEHYLFNGTQIQRNYATLFFARINEWRVVNKAYRMGLIDYVQAYSK